MNPAAILALVEQAYGLYVRIRAEAKTAGITDEQLAAITLDYDQRIARREAEAQPPAPLTGEPTDGA